ncbi:uncharacterized protein ACA1_277580 [Acanthamoeba castellanii str. Neff]|uniref:Uncharacterized protein n=1 Tax=Acanthamoeba castellanii (strain ATCC 30010 / Neff) TaxID=1257118 RepID=L8H5P9_ACACF|nr:uncharacterized protein ACA1_277580 [Acanthamoeba castellanii str. Neff]ELR20839.1 hypothetical protein ACA1_277580 [Acanthamoeba castellanii str. Neff]
MVDKKVKIGAAALVIFVFLACALTLTVVLSVVLTRDSSSSSSGSTTTYTATASAGDFVTITVNRASRYIDYSNSKSGRAGRFTYTVNADGSYDINDADGDLVRAVELPNYGILLQINKGGATANVKCLVTGMTKSTISRASLQGKAYNFFQFRTTSGGLEVGSIVFGATGQQLSHSSWWPYGAFNGETGFNEASDLSLTNATFAADGSYMHVLLEDENLYIFASGTRLAIDLPAGSLMAMRESSSASFDTTSFPGTYTTLIYRKTNAHSQPGNTESGDIVLDKAQVEVTAAAGVTVTSLTTSTVLFTGTLSALSSDSSVFGPGKLTAECRGVFIARSGDTAFVMSFTDRSVYMSSFTPLEDSAYNYFNGAGIII